MNTLWYSVCAAAARVSRQIQIVIATVLAISSLSVPIVRAQSNADSSIAGRVFGAAAADLAGATATIANKDTGFSRTVAIAANGTFQATSLPVETYVVTVQLKGKSPVSQAIVTNIGDPTSARFYMSDMANEAVQLEKFEVAGARYSAIDVQSADVGLNISIDRVEILPVARNLTAVALLTPGVNLGDTGYFGNLASFAGASQAENAYYLNGFDITDFRKGLGYGTVPFEFFQDFQIRTTGYSAMFGRSTGGVVNTVSKRGSNTFKGGFSVYWQPDSLTEKSPDSFRTNGDLYIVRSIGKTDSKQYNFYGSGALVKDKLFFYAMYNARNDSSQFVNGTNQYYYRTSNDPFWAAKFDWQALKDHAFEYTVFSNSGTTVDERYNYPLVATGANFKTTPVAQGTSIGKNYGDFGGKTQIGRYTGRFFEDLTIAVMAGKNTNNSSNRSDASNDPYVINNATSAVLSGVASVTEDLDTRKAYRADGAYSFTLKGRHTLNFGYDLEDNKAHSLVKRSGDIAYYLLPYTGGALDNSATPPAGTTKVVRVDKYQVGGDFRVITNALYVEDNYKLLDERLVLNLGLRNEGFDNRNGNDVSFVKMKNQLAPRLQGAYDLKGDGRSKVFGSWGRYYLQIPANTNIRLAGGETYYSDYYVLNSALTDKNVVLGPQVGSRVVTGTGIVPGAESIVDTNLGPMYQDEWVLGYSRELNKKWSVSVTGIFRDLKQILEDSAVDGALLNYAKSKGYYKFVAGGFDYYVLTNPGKPVTMYLNFSKDTNRDGVVDTGDQDDKSIKEKVTLPVSDLGYPPGSRKYYALEFKLNRAFSDKWAMQASYVWSHSYGNYEGSLYSDIGQSDSGITQLFDQPGLVDGTYGNLPNDKRHVFKLNGSYAPTKELTVSTNFVAQSGRPENGLGLHPLRAGNTTDAYARAYGASSMYIGGVLVPRGSVGTTPWVYTWSMSAHYRPHWANDKVSFGMDIFNILDQSAVTSVYERAELSSGAKDTRYLQPRTYQAPRSFRFSVSYDL